MPATFVVRSIRPNNGIMQVHMSRDQGQPNEVWFNLTEDVLRAVFGDDVYEGDLREISVRLVTRSGRNGPSPLSQKV